MNTEGLDKLGVGDHVALYGCGVGQRVIRSEITRITKTQIIIGHSSYRFRRKDGCLVGGGCWSHTYIGIWDADAKQEVKESKEHRRRNLIRSGIQSLRFSTLTGEQYSLLSQVMQIEKEKVKPGG
jgi:hypothetical protein